MSAPVSVCMIVRDGIADGIESVVASVRPHVAEVCVFDTGSADGTLELLAELARRPGAPIVVDRGVWTDDFAAARERSFELASQPWLMWLDADDELYGAENLAAIVADAEAADADYALALYVCDEVGTLQWPGRIFRADAGGRWEGSVYEVFRLDDWGRRIEVDPSRLHVEHRRVGVTSARYLDAIRRATLDVAHNPRAYFHLGKTLHILGRHAEAAMALDAYLTARHDKIEGRWNGIRAEALVLSTRSHRAVGHPTIADRRAREGLRYLAQFQAAFRRGEVPDPEGGLARVAAGEEWWRARQAGES